MTRQVDYGSGRYLLRFLVRHPTVRFSDVLFISQDMTSGTIPAGLSAHVSRDAMSSTRRSPRPPIPMAIWRLAKSISTCLKETYVEVGPVVNMRSRLRAGTIPSSGLAGQIERLLKITIQNVLINLIQRKKARRSGLSGMIGNVTPGGPLNFGLNRRGGNADGGRCRSGCVRLHAR